jgi:hypothetical protein
MRDSVFVEQAGVSAHRSPSAREIGSVRFPQRRHSLPFQRATSHLPTLIASLLVLFICCPHFVTCVTDRFCDPLLMAYVSIDQRRSHCLDSSWQIPPSSLVTLHFTVSRCLLPSRNPLPTNSNRNPLPTNLNKIGGYAIQAEGNYLLKRFRVFGPDDYDVALNDSFVLPRYLAERAQPIPLQLLLIDNEEGLSSR